MNVNYFTYYHFKWKHKPSNQLHHIHDNWKLMSYKELIILILLLFILWRINESGINDKSLVRFKQICNIKQICTWILIVFIYQ